jgi:hypothetical protein
MTALISKKTYVTKRTGGVGQGVGPDFQAPVVQKKKKKENE